MEESKTNKIPLYVATGVVVLVLAVGAYMFRRQIKTALVGQPQVQQVPEVSQTPIVPEVPPVSEASPTASLSGEIVKSVEVDYTPTGFSPATVTIKKGTTVKFVNKSVSPMSVASNPHPAHTDYPGFDQFKSDAKGKDEYDFVFDKVGTWGYHNHLNPSDTGTVVVTE